MRRILRSWLGTVIVGLGLVWVAAIVAPHAQQQGNGGVAIDADDIGGVVTSAKGPEAGVWVIAETRDLGTRYAKIVVTDDRGRYLLPDLPKANYDIWVRGYGLVDSAKVKAAPGKALSLAAVVAPDPHAAAQYYPAGYWASLINIPDASEFPGKGGNGVGTSIKSQSQFIGMMKTGDVFGSCFTCHQFGDKATRELSKSLGPFPTTKDAWLRRIQSGQSGADMVKMFNTLGTQRTLAMFSDWTDRIAKGELPPAPARPQGVERNIVITQWNWGDAKTYLHDLAVTDSRNPTVNANGLVYSSPEMSTENTPVLDPVTSKTSVLNVPPQDAKTALASGPNLKTSPTWGDEPIWTSRSDVHNAMLDQQGRLWMTARIRPPATPAWCRAGSSNPSAKRFPIDLSYRQAAMYDPKTKKLSYIDLCFHAHHLVFAEDANNTLWFNDLGMGHSTFGWLNTKMYDQTHDAQKSQGWTGLVLDTNGNGKRDAYVGPKDPIDPTRDKLIDDELYSVNPAPDGSIWGSVNAIPGALIRMVPGPNPSETSLAERYELPMEKGYYAARGMGVDRNGVAWVALGSGHLASFDRRKCKGALNGPKATGRQCDEGWTFYAEPVPQFKNVKQPGSAEGSYWAWVDQHNTFGLGDNTPIATGNESDGYLALKDGKWVTIRVPYPMGTYSKGIDGRIDNPNGGWKGRGLWVTTSTRTPFHMETGKGQPPIAMHIQIRPDPLAK
jgi:hypothetical protein